ncbi:MAG: hypothetical protein RL376_102 [Verrucomicrobiota bacterium]|jgi:hypothetical protein
MAYASLSDITRLRKLAGDIMCNLGVICEQIDELSISASEQDADRHNEALESLREAAITIPFNVGALETALPKEAAA